MWLYNGKYNFPILLTCYMHLKLIPACGAMSDICPDTHTEFYLLMHVLCFSMCVRAVVFQAFLFKPGVCITSDTEFECEVMRGVCFRRMFRCQKLSLSVSKTFANAEFV